MTVCRGLLGDKSSVFWLPPVYPKAKKDDYLYQSRGLYDDGRMISSVSLPTSFVRVGFSTTNRKHVIGHQDACFCPAHQVPMRWICIGKVHGLAA
jgi:hypothetical protein